MISYKNMSFGYKKNKIVINNLNLDINKGEIHGILGHNGAGKTTLFRLTLGLMHPLNGKIIINNKENILSEKISYMPSNNGLYEKLTALQNIKFKAKCFNVPSQDFKKNADMLLKYLGLWDRKNERVSTWSSGMKKRLALTCALISKPNILILDEPTNGIDPDSLNIIVKILKELNNKGTTILLSSHNLDFISKLCTSISIIKKGELVYKNNLNNTSNLEQIYLKHCGTNLGGNTFEWY